MSFASSRMLLVAAVAVAIWPVAAGADFYDDFSDGWWERDPNDPAYDANDPYWTDPNNAVTFDVDNPDWNIYDSLFGADHVANIGSDSVADKAIRLAVTGFDLFGFITGVNAAGVDDLDYDPNTSTTWFDDSESHYALAWVYYPGYYDPNVSNGFNDPNYDPNLDDPNDDKGKFGIILHGDDLTWASWLFELDISNCTASGWPAFWNYKYHANLQGIFFERQFLEPWNNGAWNLARIWIDPNGVDGDPNDTTYLQPEEGKGTGAPRDPNYDDPKWYGVSIDVWERTGFWMLFQFESDGVQDDPNNKFLRGAIWQGDKYDWDGDWLLQVEMSGPFWSSSGGETSDWYFPEGFTAFVAWSDPCYTNGFPAASVYDNIEVRRGVFDSDAKLIDLQIKNSKYGQVKIDPELVDPNDTYDPNLIDPNDGTTFPQERLLRYTTGTEVVLVAEPLPDRSFKSWTIYDPNYPGDGNYATLDTNAVIYLTMDADYEVEALFNCGSGVPPFVAMTLLALGLGVVIRRMV